MAYKTSYNCIIRYLLCELSGRRFCLFSSRLRITTTCTDAKIGFTDIHHSFCRPAPKTFKMVVQQLLLCLDTYGARHCSTVLSSVDSTLVLKEHSALVQERSFAILIF